MNSCEFTPKTHLNWHLFTVMHIFASALLKRKRHAIEESCGLSRSFVFSFVCGTNTEFSGKGIGRDMRSLHYAICTWVEESSARSQTLRVRRQIIALFCPSFSVCFDNFTFVELGSVCWRLLCLDNVYLLLLEKLTNHSQNGMTWQATIWEH